MDYEEADRNALIKANRAIKWKACGRGICAAPAGHEGSCAEASGWIDEEDE